MSSLTGSINEENVENDVPSTLLCTNGSPPTIDTNSSKVKRNDYLKQRGRRKKWWYFNRSLQPISEAGENKDDPPSIEFSPAESINDQDECLNIKNNSLNEITSDRLIINNQNIQQSKESYSPCLKVIEKFQEIVMDSAVRVIQAAFKRFRERRRFLRIKKAVMVIQRNLRKWIQSRHPCLRPAEFNRQYSDSARSDEYRESEDKNVDRKILTGNDDNSVESEGPNETNTLGAHELSEQSANEKEENSNRSESCEVLMHHQEYNLNESIEACADNICTLCEECSIDHQQNDGSTLNKSCDSSGSVHETKDNVETFPTISIELIENNIENNSDHTNQGTTSSEDKIAMDYQDKNHNIKNCKIKIVDTDECCQTKDKYEEELDGLSSSNNDDDDDDIPNTSGPDVDDDEINKSINLSQPVEMS